MQTYNKLTCFRLLRDRTLLPIVVFDDTRLSESLSDVHSKAKIAPIMNQKIV